MLSPHSSDENFCIKTYTEAKLLLKDLKAEKEFLIESSANIPADQIKTDYEDYFTGIMSGIESLNFKICKMEEAIKHFEENAIVPVEDIPGIVHHVYLKAELENLNNIKEKLDILSKTEKSIIANPKYKDTLDYVKREKRVYLKQLAETQMKIHILFSNQELLINLNLTVEPSPEKVDIYVSKAVDNVFHTKYCYRILINKKTATLKKLRAEPKFVYSSEDLVRWNELFPNAKITIYACPIILGDQIATLSDDYEVNEDFVRKVSALYDDKFEVVPYKE